MQHNYNMQFIYNSHSTPPRVISAFCPQVLCNMDYAPTSFWRWLSEASVAALKDAKQAIEHEIANKEDQEKQAFL